MSRVLPTPVARAKQSEGNSRSKSVTAGTRREWPPGRRRGRRLSWAGNLRDAVEDFQRLALRRPQAEAAGDGVDVSVHGFFHLRKERPAEVCVPCGRGPAGLLSIIYRAIPARGSDFLVDRAKIGDNKFDLNSRSPVPEGRLRIAQRFIAGLERRLRPIVPEGRLKQRARSTFQPSLRDWKGICEFCDPAINRWAIFKCPSGAKTRGRSIQPLQPGSVLHASSPRTSNRACCPGFRGALGRFSTFRL